MTETPKCPYCGTEMIRTDNITTACMSSRYTCRECGSAAPQVNELDWAKFPEVPEIAREAALRRAEPESTYRQLSKALCGKENATLNEMLEAVEQLKYRAEPEMRPMTLEEISEKVYNTDWDFVWFEVKGDIFLLQLCPRYVNEEVLYFCWPLSYDEIEANVEEMGKSWRCWPRKPTPEQMAAEKWEE